jgi:hypothetical protein
LNLLVKVWATPAFSVNRMIRRQSQKEKSLARTTLALFATVWLNMAMQPCLMAAEPMLPDGHGDCPHCPTVDHCVEMGESRCDFVDSYEFDGRNPPQPDPHPVFVAALCSAPMLPNDAVSEDLRYGYRVATDSGPPIYKRACRYLN